MPCGLTKAEMVAAWELHQKYEFADKDVAATMTTMNSHPFVTHVPTMEGGNGVSEITEFYGADFVPCNPPDIKTEVVSRTVGDMQIVDELIVSFTHTQEVTWILPGVKPTNKHVRIPLVVIVGFADGAVSKEHIHWDQASVLYQVGLLQKTEETKRCCYGSEIADCVLHKVDPLHSK